MAAVAGVTQRLAVLLGAGVTPVSAWGYLEPTSVVTRVVESRADPTGIADEIVAASAGLGALESGGWRGLAAAWSVATDSGAPLAESLRDYAASLRALAQSQRDVEVALAAPVATARMVMVLPAIGVLFGMVLGFDTARTLFATPIGWACLVVGGGLILAALSWNRRLVRAAQPTEAAPGIECDLMAIALAGGGSLVGARAMLDSALTRFALDATTTRIDAVLQLSARAGVPAAELLRSEADEARRSARATAQEKAAALSVKLMLPLGLCILPAFMVLGVFPLLVAVISSTVESF
ncbi:MAG: type II secretion system F family protein [Rhodoglobus sp.]